MTQEEKQLLLKDLCARLPYSVKYKTYLGDTFTLKDITLSKTTTEYYIDNNAFSLNQIKPYLRQMSSMTEEERNEYDTTFAYYGDCPCYTIKTFDFLNKKHFDYRELIPMGLALEATEGMYKITI